jgi:2-keto-4-pentenoate hydratase/2-oxohepta-3-ene-1,7-dioic acid hydratase in catechol pathway
VKLGTVRVDGAERVAVAIDADVDPNGGRAVLLAAGVTVTGLIGEWASARAGIERLVAAAAAPGSGVGGPASVAVADLEWLPPVPRPGKVVCVALNNSANAERIISGPGHPAAFTKPASSLLGHGRPIRLRRSYGRVHPEPELAVVVGAGGSSISPEAALGHVFGYTIINDLTSPTMRAEDTFHYRAIHPRPDGAEGVEYVDTWVSYPARYKGSDGFGPIGPWITTADEVPDPHALTVSCLHAGRLVTSDSTANLTHKVADVIAFFSDSMTLEPGDVIAMGTALQPSAAGELAIQNVNLVALGGPIEVTISGLGTLSNPVEVR